MPPPRSPKPSQHREDGNTAATRSYLMLWPPSRPRPATRTSTDSSSWPAPSTPTSTKTGTEPAAWNAEYATSRPSSTIFSRRSTGNHVVFTSNGPTKPVHLRRRPVARTLHRSAVQVELMATARGALDQDDCDHRKANFGRVVCKLCQSTGLNTNTNVVNHDRQRFNATRAAN